jgi:hypothetical protein
VYSICSWSVWSAKNKIHNGGYDMNIDDFINEIENTNKRFKTKQEEEYLKLLKSYSDVQRDVIETAFFKDNMKEIINDTYRVLKSSAEYFLAEEISSKHKISLEVACERIGLNLDDAKMGDQFISAIIYPTLLNFCLEVLKITKDNQK